MGAGGADRRGGPGPLPPAATDRWAARSGPERDSLRVPRRRRRRTGDRAATPRRRLTPRRPLKPDDLEGQERVAPLEMSPEEFRRLGHRLVYRIASFLAGIRTDPLTPGETPAQLRPLIGRPPVPQDEAPADRLMDEAAELVLGHSLRNGHPRFMGYVTPSAAPIGALADLLASAVNP